ncbi:uncharacterized protein J3D65DRAFT_118984 [Phyllosticta citribraziliensis]|uniref:Secreted protein n=1 Tax=Phyllosticta citribraziliensis TaxID=989973 RepID=A0ABR1LCI0_9PEZI
MLHVSFWPSIAMAVSVSLPARRPSHNALTLTLTIPFDHHPGQHHRNHSIAPLPSTCLSSSLPSLSSAVAQSKSAPVAQAAVVLADAPESLTPRFSRRDLYPPPLAHSTRATQDKQARFVHVFLHRWPPLHKSIRYLPCRCTPSSPVRSDGLAWLHPTWAFALSAALRILHHHTCQTDRATLRGRWPPLRPRVTTPRMSARP